MKGSANHNLCDVMISTQGEFIDIPTDVMIGTQG